MKGALYASPAVVFALAFFVVPLALVGEMSASDWPLVRGRQGTILPDNYTAATDDRRSGRGTGSATTGCWPSTTPVC